MGHYDECREGYCSICGQTLGNCIHTQETPKPELAPTTPSIKTGLKSLNQYNAEASRRIREMNTYPQLNGIGCPKCGSELMDTDSSILCSYPAQKRVMCSKCDYMGYRIA